MTPVPDDLRGEEVFAFIVEGDTAATGDPTQRASSLIGTCGDYIAYHKLPGYVVFVDKLPVSSTQKLQRGEIKTMAAKAVEEGSAIDLRKLKAAIRKGRLKQAFRAEAFLLYYNSRLKSLLGVSI